MKRIFNVCSLEVQREVDKLMSERIESGFSRLYPERSHFSKYDITHRYILINYACAVMEIKTRAVFDMELHDFNHLMTFDHDEVEDQLSYNRVIMSYEQCMTDDTKDSFLDVLPDSDEKLPVGEAIKSCTTDSLMGCIECLTSLQKNIIEGIYFRYKTEAQLGVELNMSQPHVHYYKKKALQRLQELCLENGIEPEDLEL